MTTNDHTNSIDYRSECTLIAIYWFVAGGPRQFHQKFIAGWMEDNINSTRWHGHHDSARQSEFEVHNIFTCIAIVTVMSIILAESGYINLFSHISYLTSQKLSLTSRTNT